MSLDIPAVAADIPAVAAEGWQRAALEWGAKSHPLFFALLFRANLASEGAFVRKKRCSVGASACPTARS